MAMNILVINGSPKGEKSNTYQLTSAFLRGIKQKAGDAQIKECAVCRMDIKPCLGRTSRSGVFLCIILQFRAH